MSDSAQEYHWRGILTAGDNPGTVRCTLTDSLGAFVIQLQGYRVDGGYWLTGTPGPNPEELKVPDTDGEWR